MAKKGMIQVIVHADKFTKKMDQADKGIEKEIPQALLKAGFIIEKKAKELAPVDTGRLRASIHTKKISKSQVAIQDGVSYGVAQEYGTSKTPAHPFLRPAVDLTKAKVQKLIGGRIQTVVKKVEKQR